MEGKSEEEIKELYDKSHKDWEKYNKHPFLEGKEKESQPREDYDNFHDGAGIGINSENFM